jgi:putative transposase
MSPYARQYQLAQSLTFHVYNRSNAKAIIFRDDQDYEFFISALRRYVKLFALRIYHWAVMPTHYHLLLEIEEPESLSKAIAGISLSYTQYFHKQYTGCGYLWQGRFKSQPVQKEKYLIACGRYIDSNPVEAMLVSSPEQYLYSSARYYCLGIEDGVTVTDPMYEEWGAEKVDRQCRYAAFLGNYDSVDDERWNNMEVPQGDKEFIKKLVWEKGRLVSRRRGGFKQKKDVVTI